MRVRCLTSISDDPANSIAAGAISGMIFKSTKGTKPMLISGGLVACAAGIWSVSLTLTCDRPRCKFHTNTS
jgi:hypothetical protein